MVKIVDRDKVTHELTLHEIFNVIAHMTAG